MPSSQWILRGAYPKKFMLLSCVMLHMYFVNSVWSLPDDELCIGKILAVGTHRVLRRHLLSDARCREWPPDTSFDDWPHFPDNDWESSESPFEFATQCQHLVLHEVGFANEYEEEEATLLRKYKDLEKWTMEVTGAREETPYGEVNAVRKIGHISAIDNKDTSFDLLFDSGATHSFTNNLSDFVSPLSRVKMYINGFVGNAAHVNQKGTVEWQVLDDTGKYQTIRTEAHLYRKGRDASSVPHDI